MKKRPAHFLRVAGAAGYGVIVQTDVTRLHADTLATVRVALRSDPARLDTATIQRATANLVAGLSSCPRKPESRGVNQAEASRILGVSRWSIRRLVADGKLTQRRLLTGLVRFDRAEVEGLLHGGVK